MKKTVFSLAFLLLMIGAFGQDANALVREGVALHDKGDHVGAIEKYDAALRLKPDHDLAMYEKSYSLILLKKYNEAADLLRKVLDISKEPDVRLKAYVNYGTVLDYNGQKKESLTIYDKGIKEFPADNMLHYNKGITEVGMNKAEDAVASFKNSVRLDPLHASSHNALGRMLVEQSRIKGVLSIFSFLIIEPEGKRAQQNVDLLDKLIMKGVSQKDEKNVTINIDASSLDKKKSKEDDFSSAEFMLSLLAATVPDSLKNKSDADKLHHKMESLIAVIDETNDKDKGFFKNFYIPFFVEMKSKGYLRTACFVALTSSGKEDIYKWQNDHKGEVEDFLTWVEGYKWTK